MADMCGCGSALLEGQAVCQVCLDKARENYASIHTGGPMVHFDVTAAPAKQDVELTVRITNVVRQSKIHRWNAPGRAKVTHPQYGETVVPCRSKLAAIQCAADVWGCGWTALRSAEVRAV